MSRQQGREAFRAIGLVGAIGIQLAVSLILGITAGRYADDALHTRPWLMLLGIFLGLAAGFWGAYKMIMRGHNTNRE